MTFHRQGSRCSCTDCGVYFKSLKQWDHKQWNWSMHSCTSSLWNAELLNWPQTLLQFGSVAYYTQQSINQLLQLMLSTNEHAITLDLLIELHVSILTNFGWWLEEWFPWIVQLGNSVVQVPTTETNVDLQTFSAQTGKKTSSNLRRITLCGLQSVNLQTAYSWKHMLVPLYTLFGQGQWWALLHNHIHYTPGMLIILSNLTAHRKFWLHCHVITAH